MKTTQHSSIEQMTRYFSNNCPPVPAGIKFANNYQFTRNIVGWGDDNKGVLSAVHKDSVGLFWKIRKDLRHSEVLCAHCEGTVRPPADGLTEGR